MDVGPTLGGVKPRVSRVQTRLTPQNGENWGLDVWDLRPGLRKGVSGMSGSTGMLVICCPETIVTAL